MTRKEFILGMCIIAFCITVWTIIDEPKIPSTVPVRITQQYTIKTVTDEEGNVEVEVK